MGLHQDEVDRDTRDGLQQAAPGQGPAQARGERALGDGAGAGQDLGVEPFLVGGVAKSLAAALVWAIAEVSRPPD